MYNDFRFQRIGVTGGVKRLGDLITCEGDDASTVAFAISVCGAKRGWRLVARDVV